MLQRDYIMRLIRQFFEALEKLKEEKEGKKDSSLQMGFHSMYRAYFMQPETFFYEQDKEYLLRYLTITYPANEILFRIEMLAELFYQDASVKSSSEESKDLLEKSLYLLEYLDTHSDTFSFERRKKIGEIKKLMIQ